MWGALIVLWKRTTTTEHIEDQDPPDELLSPWVHSCYQTVSLQFGESDAGESIISQDHFIAYLQALKSRLEAVTQYNERYTDAIVNALGPSKMPNSLPSIIAEHGKAVDVDAARAYISELYRYGVMQTVGRDKAVGKVLAEDVDDLGKAIAALRSTQIIAEEGL